MLPEHPKSARGTSKDYALDIFNIKATARWVLFELLWVYRWWTLGRSRIIVLLFSFFLFLQINFEFLLFLQNLFGVSLQNVQILDFRLQIGQVYNFAVLWQLEKTIVTGKVLGLLIQTVIIFQTGHPVLLEFGHEGYSLIDIWEFIV